MFKTLVINPGSTSTKIGVFEDENPIFIEVLRHDSETIKNTNQFSISMILEEILF